MINNYNFQKTALTVLTFSVVLNIGARTAVSITSPTVPIISKLFTNKITIIAWIRCIPQPSSWWILLSVLCMSLSESPALQPTNFNAYCVVFIVLIFAIRRASQLISILGLHRSILCVTVTSPWLPVSLSPPVISASLYMTVPLFLLDMFSLSITPLPLEI